MSSSMRLVWSLILSLLSSIVSLDVIVDEVVTISAAVVLVVDDGIVAGAIVIAAER